MTFLDDIGNTFKSAGEATGKGFKDGFNDVGDGFQSFGESAGEISSKIPGFLKKLEKGTIHEIKDALNEFGLNPQLLLIVMLGIGAVVVLK